jgi:hypothetical protein
MKLNDIGNSIPTLNRIAEAKLPIKTAYRIRRILKKVEEAWEPANEQINGLIQKMGEPVEGGGYRVKAENVAEYQQELRELLEAEADFEIYKISIEEFGTLEISPVELETIAWMLSEE